MRNRLSWCLVAVFGVSPVSTSETIAQDPLSTEVWASAEGNWNDDANWALMGLVENGFVPSAAFGEGAQIANGSTAIVDSAVPDIANFFLTSGTVDIRQGGSLKNVGADDVLVPANVDTRGTLRLSGNGSFETADLVSSGRIWLTSTDATLNVTGDLNSSGTIQLDITGGGTPKISVGGDAQLGGTIEPTLTGVKPAFGDSFEFLSGARSVTDNGAKIVVPPTVSLDSGLALSLATTSSTAAIAVVSLPILTVDRVTGKAHLRNVVGGPLDLKGYSIRSELGLLSPENWTSLNSQGLEGWTEANPRTQQITELNLVSSSTLEVGESLDLGNAYNGGATHPRDEDVTLEFTTSDGRILDGILEYTGPVNNLVLQVNPDTGEAKIQNFSRFIDPIDVSSYSILSASGSLNMESWNSFVDSGLAGDGWTEANPRAEALTELNLESSKVFDTGTSISLGNIFTTGGTRDLVLQFSTVTGEDLFIGTVEYGVMEVMSWDCNGDGVIDITDANCTSAADIDSFRADHGFIAGDLNGDGSVSFPDFLVLSANFGQAGQYTDGDLDKDGTVAFPDFLTLSANFGKTAGGTAAVPEPTIGLLGLIGVMGLGVLRRRRHQDDALKAEIAESKSMHPGAKRLFVAANAKWLFLIVFVVATPDRARADFETGLVAYWPFDGNFEDAFSVHDGEQRGTVPIAFEPAQFGQGIRLNGEEQHVEITGGDESDFDFAGGDMSISAWFKVDAFDTSWQALIAKGEQDRWRLHRLGAEPGLAFTGGNAGDTATGVAVDDGEFHHVVAISEAGANARIWIDGVLSAESGVSTLGNNDMNVRIGENPDATGREWEGFIDDVAIWGRALTDTEISQIWASGAGNSIEILLAAVAGDFNGDGAVDTADFMILADNFGTGNMFAQGDNNFDGRVDFQDFVEFVEVFNAGQGATAAVPEPGSMALLGMAGGALLLGMRRRCARP